MKINCNETLAVSLHRVFNADLNEHGTVFGGRILELVDGEASVAAMRVTRSTVVTAAMDHVQFLKPFHLQDSMCMEAYVTGVGHRSLEVFVKVIGEHLMTGERFVGFSCLYVKHFIVSCHFMQDAVQMLTVGVRDEYLPEFVSCHQFYQLLYPQCVQLVKDVIQQK